MALWIGNASTRTSRLLGSDVGSGWYAGARGLKGEGMPRWGEDNH